MLSGKSPKTSTWTEHVRWLREGAQDEEKRKKRLQAMGQLQARRSGAVGKGPTGTMRTHQTSGRKAESVREVEPVTSRRRKENEENWTGSGRLFLENPAHGRAA